MKKNPDRTETDDGRMLEPMKLDGALPTAHIRLAYRHHGKQEALTVGRQFMELTATEDQLLKIAKGEAILVGWDPLLYVEGSHEEQDLCVRWCRQHGGMPRCHACGDWQTPTEEMIETLTWAGLDDVNNHLLCDSCLAEDD